MEHDCVFCKIVKKEIPAHLVFEDKDFIAFLDVDPRAPGHVQVIPKEHYRWVWDVPNIGEYFNVVKKIALAIKKAYATDIARLNVSGEEIHHAHVWVWPELPKDGTEKDFVGHEQKIIQSLT